MLTRSTFRITHPQTASDELEFGHRTGCGFWISVYSLVGHLHFLERQKARPDPAPLTPLDPAPFALPLGLSQFSPSDDLTLYVRFLVDHLQVREISRVVTDSCFDL